MLPAQAKFAYNRFVSQTTGRTSFRVAYGCNPLSPLELVLVLISEISGDVEARVQEIQRLYEEAFQATMSLILPHRAISEGEKVESGNVGLGASVVIEGTLVRSEGSKQKVELKVARLAVIGKSDPSAYPIQKKRASREFLRTIAHLRPRTNTFGAVTRVRNALAYATHKFFQENGFVWISTPIITASDCEGAGEQFCVTTLKMETISRLKMGFGMKQYGIEVEWGGDQYF
ncbi:asparagine--tRNA ligase, chloroplastic/mitochondrial-like [Phalaenopsis equestris]|uniref:asparagine--tRNA ligase, chloroplastic/mitochondrial-like n=1 Tax=Phalaenopsis equestris TaxID=78828 RepID=UPI0009E5B2A9|nr:asparagine--tRNA ligase, chloroplastic/mitochondrial-like [Phalaenopsis equestris]